MPRAANLVAFAALLPTLAAAIAAADDGNWPVVDRHPALSPGHMCGSQGKYAPGGAYEANLRFLAATVAAKVNEDCCNCSNGNIAGDSPNRVVASGYCRWRPDAKSPDCGACVALAFREAQRLCPYQRQVEAVAVVDGGACSVNFHDYDLMEQYVRFGPNRPPYWSSFWLENALEFPDVLLVPALFQAAGFGCLVFLFIQEWRSRRRGSAIASDDYLPVTGGQ